GGAWDGNGIGTSAATSTTTIGVASAQQVKGLANPTDTAVFAGQTVTGSDTLVMYTYGGDANLDGKINVDDYGLIDSNVPIQGAPFPTGSGAGLNGGLNGVTAVPEPASVVAL